jgi:protein O-GlcNAc transferase
MNNARIDELFKKAVASHEAGDYAGAEDLYHRILKENPRHAGALFRLGDMAFTARCFEDAVSLFRKALKNAPGDAGSELMLANACQAAGKTSEAERILRRHLQLPTSAGIASKVAFNLTNLYFSTGRYEDALKVCQGFLEKFHDEDLLLIKEGEILTRLGRCDEAIALYDTLLGNEKLRGRVMLVMSGAFSRKRDYSGYVRRVDPEIRKNPDGNLCSQAAQFYNRMGLLEDEIRIRRLAVEKTPGHPQLHSDLLNRLTASDAVDERAIFECAREWDGKFGTPTDRAPYETYLKKTCEGGRLRLGILSRSFRRHPTATLLLPLLPELAKHFELFGYSDLANGDDYTEKFRRGFGRWRDISGLLDCDAAQVIYDDALDALIDLSGHFDGGRVRILCYRPAPVVIHYYGSSCSLGVKAVGYRISDAIVEPPERGDPFSSEKVLRLPRGFYVYEPLFDAGAPCGCPSEKNGFITFGSVAAPHKVTPTTLRLWESVLNAVPGSRFLFAREELADPGIAEYWVGRFAEFGIARERLVLVSGSSDDFARLVPYREIDMVLDTFPYSGVTTTLDALWMGVPVVTYRETRFINRLCSSLLSQAGLGDLVAETPEAFVRISQSLAADVGKRTTLRRELRGRMKAGPLGDAAGLARDIRDAVLSAVGECPQK